MKSENTTFYNSDDNTEHILTVKRKKFPWWVLLFLLIPLFFVIKCHYNNKVAVVPQTDTTQKDTIENIVVEQPKIEEQKTAEEPKTIEEPNPVEQPKTDHGQKFKGEGGDLRINLQWYNESDLDLKVTDPCGQEIRYKMRTATCNGGTGKLDVDANVDTNDEYTKTPQENIFFTNPSKGDYIIKVNCYEKRIDKPAVDFNITIIDSKGNRKDVPGKIKQGETVTVTTWKEE